MDDNIKEVNEILYKDFTYKYNEVKEDFVGVIDNCVITSFWTEDESGDNYKGFVKIKDIKNETVDIYEGTCTIIKDNIVLF